MSSRVRSLALAALAVFALGSIPAEAGSFGRKKPASSSSNEEEESSASSSSSSSSSSRGRARESSSSTATSDGSSSRRSSSSSSGSFGRTSGGRSSDDRASTSRPRHRPTDDGDRYSYPRYYERGYSRRAYAYYYEPVYVSPWGYYAYGYTPVYGTPAPPPAQVAPTPRTTTLSMFVGAHLPTQSGALTGDLAIDGERFGVNVRGLALGLPDPYEGGFDMMPMFSAHLAWSPIATPHARVRLEGGFSTIVAPDLNYTGPDFGLSGQLALAGPLSLHGALHVTPFPAQMVDTEAGIGAQFGTLGLKLGWRRLALDDRQVNVDGGGIAFNGPQFSIGTVF